MQHLPTNTLLQGGKYKIERVLGQGGFGITYLATQVGLNRKVAIKEFFMREYCNRDTDTSHVTVGSEGSRDVVEKFRSKFVKEAQNIACLKHPHIISIYDVFEDNGTAYYVMEYLDHGSLAELVKRQGRLSEADALSYIRQIADALRYIHARKMNHLDVKPGNILIDETDSAVLIDFGLSKRYDDEGNQTSTTPVGISHGYAPLEQYKKGGVGTFSPSTDIYSLGATLYKLITGDTPPDANDILTDGLTPLNSVSHSVFNAIEQAMQPNKNNRPQSLDAFLTLLGAKEDEETMVMAPSISPRGGRTPNIAEEDIVDKQTKENSPALSPLQGGALAGGRGLKGTSEMQHSEMKRRGYEKKQTKKWLWPLFICIVAVAAFFGVSTYSEHRAEVARLAAIEQHRLDSIAKVKEAVRLAEEVARQEQLRKDSIEEVARRELIEQQRKDSIEAAELRKKEQTLTSCTGIINGHKYVDLGLSVKWATCNIGSNYPWIEGNYYAWGEVRTKSKYTQENCITWNKMIDDIAGNSQYDAARAIWGGKWRLPTKQECEELINKCIWEWTFYDEAKGYKVIGPNGNYIFLPEGRSRSGDHILLRSGCYFSSTPYFWRDGSGYEACHSYQIGFSKDTKSVGTAVRSRGQMIRPIIE